MATLFDYLNWRGDLSFTEAPLCEVDSLIFAMLSYIDLSDIVPEGHTDAAIPIRSAANAFFAQNPDVDKISLGLFIPKNILQLFFAVKETRRFRNVEIRAYINRVDHAREMQFSATTYLIDGVGAVIAYRGTDDTLIGWKEDFNMCFMPEIPAQSEATAYLNAAAAASPSLPLYVTGHSKGGNLAVWAAMHATDAAKSRMVRVWCNDGPGFYEGTLDDPAYIEISPIIQYFVPQGTVVGLLLEHSSRYTVVKSRQVGVLQHDGMTWDVMGGSFVCVEDVTDGSKRIDRTMREWLRKMNTEQRTQFVDALYQLIASDKSLTLTDLANWRNLGNFKKFLTLDPEVRRALQKLISILLDAHRKKPTYKALP